MSQHAGSLSITLLALILGQAMCACPSPGSSSGSTAAPLDVDLEGQWLLQLESTPTAGQEHGEYEELFVSFFESDDQTLVFMDLDGDQSFGEALSVPFSEKQGTLKIDSKYQFQGLEAKIKASLDYVVWGYVAGSWIHTEGGEQTEYHAVGLRVANAPQHDLQGTWSMSLDVNWTSEDVAWLTGSKEECEWIIEQQQSGPLRGLLRVTDQDGLCFIGMVNDTQVTLARRYESSLGLLTYTFPTIYPEGDYMSGQLQADLENGDGLHELGWTFEGYRGSAAPSGSSLVVLDDRDQDEGQVGTEVLHLHGPSGELLLELEGGSGSSAAVLLAPGRWTASLLGGSAAAPLTFESRSGEARVLRLSALAAR